MQERPESEKTNHTKVRYENPAQMPETTCSNCVQFIKVEPPRCKTVKQPIHPTGWCQRHKKKEEARAAGFSEA